MPSFKKEKTNRFDALGKVYCSTLDAVKSTSLEIHYVHRTLQPKVMLGKIPLKKMEDFQI